MWYGHIAFIWIESQKMITQFGLHYKTTRLDNHGLNQ